MVSMSRATVAVLTCSAACIVRFIDRDPNSSDRAYVWRKESDVLFGNGGVPASQDARSDASEKTDTAGVVSATPERHDNFCTISGSGVGTSRIESYNVVLVSEYFLEHFTH